MVQHAPLLKSNAAAKVVLAPSEMNFVNFNEKEESTCIASITLLQHSFLKAYIVVPVLSVLTLFFLPLKMYWDNALNARMIYNVVADLT